ncbi:hypothetical protein Taro_028195, partial [Colocasia esculenta]|nr:hypothetical protein [Colocasia esculenta]
SPRRLGLDIGACCPQLESASFPSPTPPGVPACLTDRKRVRAMRKKNFGVREMDGYGVRGTDGYGVRGTDGGGVRERTGTDLQFSPKMVDWFIIPLISRD